MKQASHVATIQVRRSTIQGLMQGKIIVQWSVLFYRILPTFHPHFARFIYSLLYFELSSVEETLYFILCCLWFYMQWYASIAASAMRGPLFDRAFLSKIVFFGVASVPVPTCF